jgi:hypothetical protein
VKADAPGTAVAAFHEDLAFIEEFHGLHQSALNKEKGEWHACHSPLIVS